MDSDPCLSSTSSQPRPVASSTTTLRVIHVQVDLPAEDPEYPLAVPGAMATRRPSPNRHPTVLSVPSTDFGVPTPSSIGSIVDYDDDDEYVAIDITGVPPLQSRGPLPPQFPSKLLPRWKSNWALSSQRKAPVANPADFLTPFPRPFIDDSPHVVAAVPLHAPKPMTILPGWWC